MSVAVSRRRFTTEDYHRMVDAGILREKDRVELIDGEVLAMSPIGPRHCACVDRATRALVMAVGDSAIVRVQGSVRLDRYHEPQPDLVLLRPRADFYASRLPGPGDILLVVEVADSSIAYDREGKARIYAEMGVPEYWLADLTDDSVWVLASPVGSYRSVRQRHRGESVAPELLPGVLLPVDVLVAE